MNHVVAVAECPNDASAEWILVCNDDVTIAPSEVARLVSATASVSPAVAIVAAVTEEDTLLRMPSVLRGAIRLAGLGRLEYLWEHRVFGKDAAVPTGHQAVAKGGRQVPFWLVAIRIQAFREVGGFPEVAPLYFEDVMLQARLQRAGYSTECVLVEACHRGSESGKRAAAFAIPAAVQGYVHAMREVRGCSMWRGRLVAAGSCLVGLVVALARIREKGFRVRVAGLLSGVWWCLRPKPVELDWRF